MVRGGGAGEARRRERPARHSGVVPVWVWAALLAGAVVNLWWVWFLNGFLNEPSAVGRVEMVLVTSMALSSLAGIFGAIGAVGLLRREAWSRRMAWIGAGALTISGVGAVGGIPALVGLLWSRKPATP